MAKKKTTAVGKTAKPAKTPVPTRQKLQSEITSLHREVSSLKHGHAAKKHKATASKKHKTKTGLALAPGDVACCAAQALAASLRLALSVSVHDEDVLALYWRTAGDPDEGASVLDTLRAAREFGLAGARPVSFGPVDLKEVAGGRRRLILGLELPGPHAVLGQDGVWWSWGEPYSPADFTGAVIEDAWAVTW